MVQEKIEYMMKGTILFCCAFSGGWWRKCSVLNILGLRLGYEKKYLNTNLRDESWTEMVI